MPLDFFFERFKENKIKTSIIWNEHDINYSQLIEKISEWEVKLSHNNINSQTIVIIEGDFDPETISLLFALIEKKCIIIPIYNSNSSKLQKIIDIAQPQYYINNNNGIKHVLTLICCPSSNLTL